MEIAFGSLLGGVFLIINSAIIYYDIKEKRIPNKLLIILCCMLPFFFLYGYIYDFFLISDIILTIVQSIIILLFCFLLFHFGMWGAGDAKYVIILVLFLPNVLFLTFIGNIALVILTSLSVSYFYFYFSQLGKKGQLKNTIHKDLKSRYKNYIYNSSPKKIIFSLAVFILIFISLRVYKSYFIDGFSQLQNNYSIGILLFGTIVLIGIIGLIFFFYKSYKHKIPYLYTMFLIFFSFIFIGFLYYEYSQNKEKLFDILYKIFTLYILLFFIIKIVKYSIFIYTGRDYYLKDLYNLQENDIIERKDFNTKILPLIQNNTRILNYYSIPKYGNITINTELKKSLTALIRSINKNNKKAFGGTSIIKDFKCMKTFAFAPYLFLGFLVSFFFQDKFLEQIYEYIFNSIS